MSALKRPIRLFFESIRSAFVPGNDLSEKDTVILVIGTAGSGKTSFINKVAQDAHLSVHHSLSGGTKKISPVRCTPKSGSIRLVLVDTPPFPDDSGQIEIMSWLRNTKKIKVKGVIFMHPVTLNRGQPEKEYPKLQSLCGSELTDVPAILVVTFCKKPPSESQQTRVKELEDKWAGQTNIKGPSPTTYDTSVDGARNIVNAILNASGIDLEKIH